MKFGRILAAPFYNRAENRLRLWLRLGLTLVVYGLLYWLSTLAWSGTRPASGFAAIGTFMRDLIVISLTVFASRWLLDRQIPLVHLRRLLADIAAGFVIGALAMAVIFVTALAAGWLRIENALPLASSTLSEFAPLGLALAAMVCVGIYEELIARGYLLPNLAQWMTRLVGARWALGLAWAASAVLFGAAHFWNPNATLTSTALIMAAGLMLGLGVLLTGSIGLSVGIHIGWNWFQGAVFGFSVSGVRLVLRSLITIRVTGPALWTGGAFGPEAGLLGLAGMLTAAGLTVGWVRWRSHALRLAVELSDSRADWYV